MVGPGDIQSALGIAQDAPLAAYKFQNHILRYNGGWAWIMLFWSAFILSICQASGIHAPFLGAVGYWLWVALWSLLGLYMSGVTFSYGKVFDIWLATKKGETDAAVAQALEGKRAFDSEVHRARIVVRLIEAAVTRREHGAPLGLRVRFTVQNVNEVPIEVQPFTCEVFDVPVGLIAGKTKFDEHFDNARRYVIGPYMLEDVVYDEAAKQLTPAILDAAAFHPVRALPGIRYLNLRFKWKMIVKGVDGAVEGIETRFVEVF